MTKMKQLALRLFASSSRLGFKTCLSKTKTKTQQLSGHYTPNPKAPTAFTRRCWFSVSKIFDGMCTKRF